MEHTTASLAVNRKHHTSRDQKTNNSKHHHVSSNSFTTQKASYILGNSINYNPRHLLTSSDARTTTSNSSGASLSASLPEVIHSMIRNSNTWRDYCSKGYFWDCPADVPLAKRRLQYLSSSSEVGYSSYLEPRLVLYPLFKPDGTVIPNPPPQKKQNRRYSSSCPVNADHADADTTTTAVASPATRDFLLVSSSLLDILQRYDEVQLLNVTTWNAIDNQNSSQSHSSQRSDAGVAKASSQGSVRCSSPILSRNNDPDDMTDDEDEESPLTAHRANTQPANLGASFVYYSQNVNKSFTINLPPQHSRRASQNDALTSSQHSKVSRSQSQNSHSLSSMSELQNYTLYELTSSTQLLLQKAIAKGVSGTNSRFNQYHCLSYNPSTRRWNESFQTLDNRLVPMHPNASSEHHVIHQTAAVRKNDILTLDRLRNDTPLDSTILGIVVDYKNIEKKTMYSTSIRILDETVENPCRLNIFSLYHVELPYISTVGQIVVFQGLKPNSEHLRRGPQFKRANQLCYSIIDPDEDLSKRNFSPALRVRIDQLQKIAKYIISDVTSDVFRKYGLMTCKDIVQNSRDIAKFDLIAKLKSYTLNEVCNLEATLHDGTAEVTICFPLEYAATQYFLEILQCSGVYKFRDLALVGNKNGEQVILVQSHTTTSKLSNEHYCARQIEQRFQPFTDLDATSKGCLMNNQSTQQLTIIEFNPAARNALSSLQHIHDLSRASYTTIRELFTVGKYGSQKSGRVRCSIVKVSPFSVDKFMTTICTHCRREKVPTLHCSCGAQSTRSFLQLQCMIRDCEGSVMNVALVSLDASYFFGINIPNNMNRVTRRFLQDQVNRLKSPHMCDLYLSSTQQSNGRRLYFICHTRLR